MAEGTVAPSDLVGVPLLMSTSFDRARIAATRQAVGRCAAEHGLARACLDGFVLAVNEIVTNAVAHGGGGGRLRLWHEDAALTCEVSDDGPGVPTRYLEDHGRPPPTALHGRGLWLARHLCDLVSIVADRHGTTVRMVIVLPLAT